MQLEYRNVLIDTLTRPRIHGKLQKDCSTPIIASFSEHSKISPEKQQRIGHCNVTIDEIVISGELSVQIRQRNGEGRIGSSSGNECKKR